MPHILPCPFHCSPVSLASPFPSCHTLATPVLPHLPLPTFPTTQHVHTFLSSPLSSHTAAAHLASQPPVCTVSYELSQRHNHCPALPHMGHAFPPCLRRTGRTVDVHGHSCTAYRYLMVVRRLRCSHRCAALAHTLCLFCNLMFSRDKTCTPATPRKHCTCRDNSPLHYYTAFSLIDLPR